MERRIAEAARLGFTRCIIPASFKKTIARMKGIELIRAGNIAEALRLGLEKTVKTREQVED